MSYVRGKLCAKNNSIGFKPKGLKPMYLKKILYEEAEKAYHAMIKFTQDHLPCLIHGKEGSGASHFTVQIVADLYKQGHKIIFLSGYQMARDEFLKTIGSPVDLERVVFLQKESSTKLIELAKTMPDVSERVILIKNFELYEHEVVDSILGNSRLILSGDLDTCNYSAELLKHEFKTKIAFSDSKSDFVTIPSDLPRYSGYLIHDGKAEVVSV